MVDPAVNSLDGLASILGKLEPSGVVSLWPTAAAVGQPLPYMGVLGAPRCNMRSAVDLNAEFVSDRRYTTDAARTYYLERKAKK
jgi:hypothetical protein